MTSQNRKVVCMPITSSTVVRVLTQAEKIQQTTNMMEHIGKIQQKITSSSQRCQVKKYSIEILKDMIRKTMEAIEWSQQLDSQVKRSKELTMDFATLPQLQYQSYLDESKQTDLVINIQSVKEKIENIQTSEKLAKLVELQKFKLIHSGFNLFYPLVHCLPTESANPQQAYFKIAKSSIEILNSKFKCFTIDALDEYLTLSLYSKVLPPSFNFNEPLQTQYCELYKTNKRKYNILYLHDGRKISLERILRLNIKQTNLLRVESVEYEVQSLPFSNVFFKASLEEFIKSSQNVEVPISIRIRTNLIEGKDQKVKIFRCLIIELSQFKDIYKKIPKNTHVSRWIVLFEVPNMVEQKSPYPKLLLDSLKLLRTL